MNALPIVERMLGLTDDRSFAVFFFVTLVLGGGAAWLTGRAIAATWRPWWILIAYVSFLAGAVRFLNFALFGGLLLSPKGYAANFAILSAFAVAGFCLTRRKQLRSQYFWLHDGHRANLHPPADPGDN